MTTLRTMSNLVGGRGGGGGGGGGVKKGSVVYILRKSFCLVNVMLVSFYLNHFFCFLLCVLPSLQFEMLKLCLIMSLLDWSHA